MICSNGDGSTITDTGGWNAILDSVGAGSSGAATGAVSFQVKSSTGTYNDAYVFSNSTGIGGTIVALKAAAAAAVVSPGVGQFRALKLGTPSSRLRGVYDDTLVLPATINETVGAYSWAGTTSSASGLINAAVGTYSWAGTTSTASGLINASVGSYSWAGLTATASGLINGSVGAYSWSGTTATASQLINASVGAYSLAGTTSTASGLINQGIGTYTWAGTTSNLGGVTTIAEGLGAYTRTPHSDQRNRRGMELGGRYSNFKFSLDIEGELLPHVQVKER